MFETAFANRLSRPDAGESGLGRALGVLGQRPLLWLVLLLCLANLPIFFGQILFFRDPALWVYPARWFVREALLHGQSPFWNPQQGLGFAVTGNPLYGLFYPPNWLFLLVPDGLVVSLCTWQSLAHVVWGSLGIALVARRFGAGAAGTCVAGLAWGLSGYLTSEWTAGILLLSGAWLPWTTLGLLALVGGLRAGPAGWPVGVVKATLPMAMAILAGEPFLALMGVGFGLATASVHAWWFPANVPAPAVAARPRIWVVSVSLTVLLAAGVGAVSVLPARAVAAGTERASPIVRDLAEIGSLHPYRLAELIAPGCMGPDPYQEYPAGKWVGEPRIDGLPLLYSVYLGGGVLALALLALGRGRRTAWALAGLAVLGLSLALGRHTPVHQIVRTLVPPLAYMRFPEKYLILPVGWVALLAGLGATRLLDRGPQPWRRVLMLGALPLLFAALAPIILPTERWAVVARTAGLSGAAAVAAILAAQALAGRRSRAAAGILVISVAADLAAAGWPLQGFGPRAPALEVPLAARVIRSDYGDQRDPPRVFREERAEAMVRRFVPAVTHSGRQQRSTQTLIANTVTVFGIATVPGYDAAIPTDLDRLAVGKGQGVDRLRLAGVSYAVLGVGEPGRPGPPISGLTALAEPLPGTLLFRVEGALPRVFLAGRGDVADDRQSERRLFDPEIVAGEIALLAPDGIAASMGSVAGRAGVCQLERFENTDLQARCQAERAAVAVFVEAMAPGWSAEVDGRPAPLLRANLLMRAVTLTPGAHTIRLRYAPPGLPAGAAVSLTSLLLLLALALWGHSRRSGLVPETQAAA